MRNRSFKCYCCDDIATTQEHVPPRCFFPKQKQSPDGRTDYRKNLITVPSCTKHNNQRSKDDEYTAISIILHSDSDIALSLLTSKWIKALCRNDTKLGQMMFAKSRPVVVPYLYGNLLIPQDTLAMSYEMERIDSVIKSITYGLYYHESKHQDKWLGDWQIRSPNFLMPDLSRSYDYNMLVKLTQGFNDAGFPQKGGQPDIFYYQVFKQDDKKWIFKLVFYKSMIFLTIPL